MNRDNPYVVILEADEFAEMYAEIERSIEDAQALGDEAHLVKLQCVMMALVRADDQHVCKDEEE